MQLSGRHAVITGAGQGLGAAIAEHYVRAGASVLLCGRNGAALDGVVAKLNGLKVAPGQIVESRIADVAAPAQVDELVAAALALFPKVDVLVNNAGVLGPMGLIESVDWQEWVEAISINLMGTAYPSRALIPHFRSRGYGKIVNLSGGGATKAMPHLSAYAAAKAAVVRLTETLAVELREARVDVNAVAPGALATRMLDQVMTAGAAGVGQDYFNTMSKVAAEGGTPLHHAAELCVYLGSAESDGLTGRLISAVWDPWRTLHERRAELDKGDIYMLRRIIPEDRGQKWDT